MMNESHEPRYVINVVARIIGVHAQTLRYYERMGLIRPSRSKGNIRYYSAYEVQKLKRMKSLIEDLGVNLAGVDVIMRMADRMLEMERSLKLVEQQLKMLTSRHQGENPSASEDIRFVEGEEDVETR